MPVIRGLLSGITVADFGWAVAGPCLSRFLAHHGATVIKIESHTRLDPTRMSPPFSPKPHRNGSGYFARHNAGKLSVTINLKHEEGRRIAKRLAVAADLVNENFAPGILKNLGLDYESLREERPDVILVSSSTQGQTGPHAHHPGLGVTLQGLVGLCDLTGWPDREPVGTGEPYTDTLVPWAAGTALLAVLDYRRRTGKGAHIDLSQFEFVAHALAPALLHQQLTGTQHTRHGNASPVRAPEGVYPCLGDNRWCAISVETDDQWRALAKLVQYTPAEPAEQQDLAWRMEQQVEIEAAISKWTSGQEAESVERQLQAMGIPAKSVARACDLVSDPQLETRGHWVPHEHPVMGRYLYRMPPFRLDEHEIAADRSPLIGEHTDQVMRDFLHLTDDEIAALKEDGALA